MGPWWRKLRAAAASIGWLAVASRVLAVPLAGGELSVTRSASASDCPDEPELANSTLALGKLSDERPAATLRAEVELDRDERGYVARIRTTGRKEGEREIRAPGETCTALAQATSVTLAVLFDLLPPEPQAEPPPLMPAPTPALAPPPAAPPRRTEPRDASASHVESKAFGSVSADFGSAFGLLENVVTAHLGASLHLVASETFDVGAGGFWAPGRTVTSEPGTILVSLAAARGQIVTWLLRSSHGELGARGELLVGAISGAGRGYDHPEEASGLWAAVSFGPSARYRLSQRVALRIALSAFVPLRPQRFSVTRGSDPPSVAFETTPLAGVLEFGPELAFF